MPRTPVLSPAVAVAASLVALLVAGCSHEERRVAAAGPAPADIARPNAPKFGFFFVDEGKDAKLAYGEANSDNVGLMLECAKGSQVVRVVGAAPPQPTSVLTLASAGAKADLRAVADKGEGLPLVSASAPLTSPVIAAFRRSGKLQVAYGGTSYAVAARPNEQVSLDRFFSACDGRPA